MTIVKTGRQDRLSVLVFNGVKRGLSRFCQASRSGISLLSSRAMVSLEQQLAFFQAGQAQLISSGIFREPVDGIIKVAVFNAELRKLLADGIELFVIHWVRVAQRSDISQSLR